MSTRLTFLSFSDLSRRLDLSREDGEKWIVNLIRDSKLGIDAKIDLKAVSHMRASCHRVWHSI